MDSPGVKKAARVSRNATPLRVLARVGFAVNGVVNAIIGGIAISIAVAGRTAGESADQSGAFAAIAATPGGLIFLWVIAIALAALAVWYLLGAPLAYGRDTKRRAAKILVEVGKGIAYLVLAGAAASVVRGAATSSSSQTATLTAQFMAMPGGIAVIVLIGLLFCGIGVYMVRKGISRGFERDIVLPARYANGVKALGILGYVSRGIALFIVGVLFIIACFTVDPSKATGLDGALQTLAGLPFGQALLVIVGLGFIAYGIYSVLRARLADLR